MTVVGILLVALLLGWPFYNLAKKYQKNKWIWSILGVLSFYITQFIAVMIWFLCYYLQLIPNFNPSDIYITLAMVLISILGEVLFYQILRKRWKNQQAQTSNFSEDLLDH